MIVTSTSNFRATKVTADGAEFVRLSEDSWFQVTMSGSLQPCRSFSQEAALERAYRQYIADSINSIRNV